MEHIDCPRRLPDRGGEPAAAVAAADRAIELGPSFAHPHFLRGIALPQQGKFVGAMQSINRGAAPQSEATSRDLDRGGLREPNGRSYAGGRGDVRAGPGSQPDLIVARIPLAAIYESEGRHEEARTVVEEILCVNPHFTADHAAQVSAGRAPRSRSRPCAAPGFHDDAVSGARVLPHPVKQGAVTARVRPLGRQKWEVFGVDVCRCNWLITEAECCYSTQRPRAAGGGVELGTRAQEEAARGRDGDAPTGPARRAREVHAC